MVLAESIETPPPAPTAAASRALGLLNRKPSFVEKPATATTLKSVRLAPKTLEPQRYSTSAAPLAFLSSIERIEINETRVRDGVVYYVLDVFLYHFDTRLPSILNNPRRASLVTPRGPSTTPDYQVERRFSEFALLREQAYAWSCLNPQFMCDYCNEFIMYVRFTFCQPRFWTKFSTTTTQRKKILASFLKDFVALAQFRGHHSRECEAHDNIPLIVESFVRDQGGEFVTAMRPLPTQ
ncbi:hypothetical protein PybrP1_008139 [[Pythium] brassicae (nom. inval.)]|nr:hypothetical protein PybrP1_008139 [[Pythium] brassicae (nom. inval.)]